MRGWLAAQRIATASLSISFADIGATSRRLVPTWYAKEVWKIDLKAFLKYTEGATHGANAMAEMAVQAGQADLATNFDRNRNAMIESGKVKADGSQMVWNLARLPNDAIAVPEDTPAAYVAQMQKISFQSRSSRPRP